MVLAGIFFVVARKTSEPVKEEEKIKSDDLAYYTHFIEESLEGFSIIKSHQIEAQREATFIESIDALKKQHHKIETQKSFVDALNGGLQGLIISLLIVFGLYIGSRNGVS